MNKDKDIDLKKVAIFLVLAIGGCMAIGPGLPADPGPTHTVKYVVENTYPGTKKWDRSVSASITIENESGGTEQHDVDLPWSKEFVPEPGHFLYVSAQDRGGGRGIEVSILVDGKMVRHATSTAQYGIASVSARMP